METKIYFFAKHKKRDINLKKPKDSQRDKFQALLLPKMAKPLFISSIYPNNSPYNMKRPTSLSPLLKMLSPHPRSRSYKLVNAPTKPILQKNQKSITPRKLNIRYLKQDYEDLEVMNVIRTPEESQKNSTKKFSTDWLIPEFDQIFVNNQNYYYNERKSNRKSDNFSYMQSKELKPKYLDLANQNTSDV